MYLKSISRILLASIFSITIVNCIEADTISIQQQGNLHYEKKQYSEAISLYDLSAKNGDLEGYYTLAMMYQKGYGTEINMTKAIENYTFAANHGHAKAQHNLGQLYLDDKLPFKNPELACKYFTLSAKQDNNISFNPLATLYLNGIGCEKNPAKAIEYYKKSLLAMDDPGAQYNVALMLARGVGVIKNSVLAYALWLNNASLGDENSLYNLNIISKNMNKDEIKSAQELSRDRKKMIMMITPTEPKKPLPKLL